MRAIMRGFTRPQEACRRACERALGALGAEDLAQQVIRQAAPVVAMARELAAVVMRERAGVGCRWARCGCDCAPAAVGPARSSSARRRAAACGTRASPRSCGASPSSASATPRRSRRNPRWDATAHTTRRGDARSGGCRAAPGSDADTAARPGPNTSRQRLRRRRRYALSSACPASWRRMRISQRALPPSASRMIRRSSRSSRGCAR